MTMKEAYEANDYEAILQCNLTNQSFVKIASNSFSFIAEEIFLKCKMEVKQRYPVSMLKLAYSICCSGNHSFFQKAMKELKEMIWKGEDRQLKGEWFLLSAFLYFPDLECMERQFVEAREMMERPSEVFVKEEPFGFGCPSMLFLFHSIPGEAEVTAERFTSALRVYGEITNGHGVGSDVLYRGELACIQCRYEQAEIFAYQAGYLASSKREITLVYGVALLLGRIAISRGDEQGLKDALHYMDVHTQIGYELFPQSKESNQCMREIVQCRLSSLQENHAEMKQCNEKDICRQYSMHRAYRLLQHVQINEMLLNGEFSKAYGNIKGILGDVKHCNLIQKYYMYISMAICCLGLGRKEEAVRALDTALGLAQPDDMESGFVHYRLHLEELFSQPEVVKKYKDFICRIRSEKEAFKNSDQVIYPDVPIENLLQSLTDREKEVAKLAALGLHNREIAQRLCISEWTVKNHLRSIYSKLNIDRRSQLSENIHP